MTRSERLLYLVDLIKKRGKVLVSEMARECRVSQRTIYRDINSLSRLNFPVYYDNGYRLARDTGFPCPDMDHEDIELICYSLRNNPLSDHPFFCQRFRAIEQSIQVRTQCHRRENQESLFVFDQACDRVESTHDVEIIGGFVEAIRLRRKVIITLAGRSRPLRSGVPLCVKLMRPEPVLVFSTSPSLVQEQPVGMVQSISLSEEVFDYRPLQLILAERPIQKNIDAN